MVHKPDNVKSISELLTLNINEISQQAKGRDSCLVMLNHPFWQYYDVLPQDVFYCPEIRFFEVQGGSGAVFKAYPQAESYIPEKFWDVVNAHRSLKDEPLLFGVASDDAHFYDAQRISGRGGVNNGWIMVRSLELSAPALLAAMNRGDFYATTGVFLRDLTFNKKTRALRLALQTEPGVAYRIHFITTRRGFNQTVSEITVPAEDQRPERRVPICSDEVGQTVLTVEGTEAVYHMTDSDLYVRARVESDRPCVYSGNFQPEFQAAWTQPQT
ncbi:MAG: hypothetical protein ABR497_06845 [Kiritimatiellia bacterium]|nr:hypothetical protein [Lentisphaerota bacterium]